MTRSVDDVAFLHPVKVGDIVSKKKKKKKIETPMHNTDYKPRRFLFKRPLINLGRHLWK